jgi:hypothetical protein
MSTPAPLAIDKHSTERERLCFGTKAETLASLKRVLCGASILELRYFSVCEWREGKQDMLDNIQRAFAGSRLAVRSSSQCEDGQLQSMAGAYQTCLSVDGSSPGAVESAIENVISSYAGDPNDQVLVQPMLPDVAVSGVIMTYDLEYGAPYYVINYDDETGRTDSITGGDGVHKTVLIYRNQDLGHIESDRVLKFLSLAKELEALFGDVPLDIEFGLTTEGALYLFQVRQITVCKSWHPVTGRRLSRQLEFIDRFVQERSRPRDGVAGDKSILGVMPDWNPAEIIGTTPRPLAISLYRELVTRDIWRLSRQAMGYRDLPGEELMVVIACHPYIDVRNSFNSFIPAEVSTESADRLVSGWLERLHSQPELHDKVEFEVVQSCMDFTFDARYEACYQGVLGDREYQDFKGVLTRLTDRNVALTPTASLTRAWDAINLLNRRQAARNTPASLSGMAALNHAYKLIEECKKLGTWNFSILARHAFIAESLLRSAVSRGAIDPQRVALLKRSLRTITSDLMDDYERVARSEITQATFMEKYGHLRPGTYDITSLRYDERTDLFMQVQASQGSQRIEDFELLPHEEHGLNQLLDEAGISSIDGTLLIEYARRAITGREWGKFVFTRNLSDALESLLRWGESEGLSRDDLSFLPWSELTAVLREPLLDHADRYFIGKAEEGRCALRAAQALKLGYLLRGVRDMYVVPLYRSIANYIGSGRIEAPVQVLDGRSTGTVNLFGRIACIENADPGFDWIFSKGIKGLITKFGGANSHMAIRCAEFGLPAAIGCGEQMYQRMSTCGTALLDCDGKRLGPVYGD